LKSKDWFLPLLPDLNGSLSKIVDHGAIEAANEEVMNWLSSAIQEVPTGQCHMTLLISNINISTSMQPQKFPMNAHFAL